MPSTYSSSLRLELQAQGENTNTWGIINNTNLGTLIEQAIAGVVSVSMTDANKTLTVANGASDEARNAVITLTGTLSASRDVIVPTATKTYTIRNATAGGQSVVVKTAAGTGVTIGNGFTATVYCDGTNVVQMGAQFNVATGTAAANLSGNVTGAASANVLTAGDTMTGFLTLNADPTANLHAATKAYVDAQRETRVAKSGDTMTGDLAISKANPFVFLDRPNASTMAAIQGRVAGADRWRVEFGSPVAETGGNAGSNFAIVRSNDAGAFIDVPLSISRASGVVNLAAIPEGPASDPTTGNQFARKAYVDAQRDTRVAKAGDTMTGALTVGGDVNAGGLIRTRGQNYTTGGESEAGIWVQNSGGTGDGAVAAMAFLCNGAYGTKMHLRADGIIGIGGWSASSWRWYVSLGSGDMVAAGNVVAYSDPRLKDNVRRIENALDMAHRLDGVRFVWNNRSSLIGQAGKQDVGVLADQVEAVLPEAVSLSVEDSATGESYKTVAYDKLVPVLIEAIKELSARVEALERGR